MGQAAARRTNPKLLKTDRPGPSRQSDVAPGRRGRTSPCPTSLPTKSARRSSAYHGGRLVVAVQNRFFKPRISVELSADAQIGLDLGTCPSPSRAIRFPRRGATSRRGSVRHTDRGGCPGQSARSAGESSASRPPRGPWQRRTATARGKGQSGAGARRATKPRPTNAPAKEPAEVEDPAKDPPEKDNPPGKTEAGDQARTGAADRRDAPGRETKPDRKSPTKSRRKSPRSQDDEKDIFEK